MIPNLFLKKSNKLKNSNKNILFTAINFFFQIQKNLTLSN